jgi:hypothetical protein
MRLWMGSRLFKKVVYQITEKTVSNYKIETGFSFVLVFMSPDRVLNPVRAKLAAIIQSIKDVFLFLRYRHFASGNKPVSFQNIDIISGR